MSPDQTPDKVSPSVRKEGQDHKKLKLPPPDHHSKCPRCDSPNTKFCYYNNYSLSQPRHFCKTCRRYWTKGGALRNVPIGGGCRKNKKMKQRLAGISKSRDSSYCEIMGSSSSGGGFNFFQGFLTPAMDFQLGSIHVPPPSTTSSMFPISGTDANFTLYDNQHNHDTSQLSPNHHTISSTVPTLLGFDYLRSSLSDGGSREHGGLQMGTSSNNSMIVPSNLASSIESLSSINQELHWKLQQQRLAVLFSGDGDRSEKLTTQSDMAHVGEHQFVDQHKQSQTHKFQLQPILFQNLETEKEADPFSTSVSRIEVPEATRKPRMEDHQSNDGSATEWFFDVNRYTNARNNNNNERLNNDEENDDQNHNNWNSGGIQMAWSNMQHQYDGALP